MTTPPTHKCQDCETEIAGKALRCPHCIKLKARTGAADRYRRQHASRGQAVSARDSAPAPASSAPSVPSVPSIPPAPPEPALLGSIPKEIVRSLLARFERQAAACRTLLEVL